MTAIMQQLAISVALTTEVSVSLPHVVRVI